MTEAAPKWTVSRLVFWLFAGAGLLAALAVIALAVMMISFAVGRPGGGAPAEVEVAKDGGNQRPLIVQRSDAVFGTPLVAIEVGYGDPERGSGGYSRPENPDVRNLILLDKTTGVSRRVLPNSEREVVDRKFFAAVAAEAQDFDVSETTREATKANAPVPPLAYYVLRVRKTEDQREDVLAGSFATAAQAFVLTDLDGVDRLWMLAPTRLAVLFRKGRKLHYAVIDMPTLKTVLQRPVDIG